jgi:8-oxo-dGTP diphosphatase
VKKIIENTFGNRLRIRVCGLLVEDGKILLIKHEGLGDEGYLWAPPGGGMEFGTSADENLKREFKEETGLDIDVNQYLFTHEYLNKPLHAIEHFFIVSRKGGRLALGSDPEMGEANQVIKELKFASESDIIAERLGRLHRMFEVESNPNKIDQLKGCFILTNKSLK